MIPSQVIRRRSWLIGLGASCATFCRLSPVWAGAALPISLGELVGLSRFALVGTARQSSSTWEGTGEGRRIVTYTNVDVEQQLDGRSPPAGSVTVRTLGGSVGDIGQVVHGEVELLHNVPAVFFLHDAVSDAFGITAMTQGHYALNADRDGVHRLFPSPNLSELVARDPTAAVSRLRGRTVTDCERMIAEELGSKR